MGKAIVFNGVAVATPIQTVNFVVPLNTGADYVSQYSLLATEVTAPQKTSLTTFIDTLIANSLWDKVSNCFPMLGGINGYKFDCKDLRNQKTWSLPVAQTTWDTNRNAPYVSAAAAGNSTDLGVGIPVTGIVNNNFCLIYSNKQKDTTLRNLSHMKFSDNTVGSVLINKNGGSPYPIWNTPSVGAALTGFVVNGNNVFALNYTNGVGSAKVKSNNSAVLNIGVASAIVKTIGSIGLTMSYDIAPTTLSGSAFYGNANMAVICNTGLTDAEIGIIADAIYTFNESCGRNTAW